MGKDYPMGTEFFRKKLHAAFVRHRNVRDAAEVDRLLARADFVRRELEALYFLRKYRTMKARYYDPLLYGDQQSPTSSTSFTAQEKSHIGRIEKAESA